MQLRWNTRWHRLQSLKTIVLKAREVYFEAEWQKEKRRATGTPMPSQPDLENL